MTQTTLHEDEVTVMDLSTYRFEKLRKDGEFIVYRGYHRRQSDASPSSILGMTPVSERTALASLRRIEHDYLFRAERNHDRAARLLALAPHEGRTILTFTDPSGESLDRLFGRSMELTQFLRSAISVSVAFGQPSTGGSEYAYSVGC